MNWLPRFVFEDGTVVMPEEIIDISPRNHTISYTGLPGDDLFKNGWTTVKVQNARPDRPTGLVDKNGKMIYENDIITTPSRDWRVYFHELSASWRVTSGIQQYIGGLAYILSNDVCEVTGMVPWEAKHG